MEYIGAAIFFVVIFITIAYISWLLNKDTFKHDEPQNQSDDIYPSTRKL